MNLAPITSRLPRVLEPEVMDTPDEACDYDQMDHGDVNRRFVVEYLAAATQLGLAPDAEVLDLGTGTAQIPIEFCRQNPRARVAAIDLAQEMLRLARANVDAAGLGHRISLELVDAKGLPYPDGRFAAVMSNSIVHHIPDPRSALTEALRVIQSDGLIFIRDLSRPHDESDVLHLVDTHAAGCNGHQRQLFDASLRAALTVAEMRTLVTQLGFQAASVQPTSDRHWTWSAAKR